MAMKFSLVLCSVGRDEEVRRFLDSLSQQTYSNYELIIIDQNEDNRLEKIIENYSDKIKAVKYHRVNFKGLSKARNYGINYIAPDADVIAFPDDDCIYPANLLEKVKNEFEENPNIDILTGISIDDKTGDISSGRWLSKDAIITLRNVWLTAISYTIFIRFKPFKRYVYFDENLGVGAKFGSGEETDLILRLLKINCKAYFKRNIVVYHPNKYLSTERARKYSMGTGAVFKKNFIFKFDYLMSFLNLMLLRPIGGIILNIFKLRFSSAKLYVETLLFRWLGFIRYKKQKV